MTSESSGTYINAATPSLYLVSGERSIMDKFWITKLDGGRIFEVEVSGWVFFARRQMMRALLQIQNREGRTVTSIHRFPGMWTHRYLVFTVIA